MVDLTGYMIGRYHVVTRLGTGGMATVYKAHDTRLARYVAMKFIRTDVIQDETFVKRFDREAKALAKLSHPNIVSILDYGDYEGTPYLVMEYITGGSLKEHMGKPIPWSEALKIILPIANALEYTHQHNIIHRDVKPANFLISESGEPLLADFGIAKIVRMESTQITGKGGLGTPAYMAPEQGMGQPADPRTDVYSLGVVLYELITGRAPYIAPSTVAILYKHISEPLPSPRNFVPDLPIEIEKILTRSMEKKPDNRYQTMADFSAAMERMLRTAATHPNIILPEEKKPSAPQPPITPVEPLSKPVPPVLSATLEDVAVPPKQPIPLPQEKPAPIPPSPPATPLKPATTLPVNEPEGSTVVVDRHTSQPYSKPAGQTPSPDISIPGASGMVIKKEEAPVAHPTLAESTPVPSAPAEPLAKPGPSPQLSEDDIETVEVRLPKPALVVKPQSSTTVSTPATSQDHIETVEVSLPEPSLAQKQSSQPEIHPPVSFPQSEPMTTISKPSIPQTPQPVYHIPEPAKYTPSSPVETSAEGENKTATLLGLPRKTLIICGVIGIALACIGLIIVVAGYLGRQGKTGSLEINVEVPAELGGQQNFEIVVNLRNTGDDELTVSEIRLPKSFFNGLVLTGVDPEVQQQEDTGSAIGYQFSLPLQPGEEAEVRFGFRAEGAAEYAGVVEARAGSVKASTEVEFSTIP